MPDEFVVWCPFCGEQVEISGDFVPRTPLLARSWGPHRPTPPFDNAQGVPSVVEGRSFACCPDQTFEILVFHACLAEARTEIV